MRLDRNMKENDGRGKYAILKLRNLHLCESDSPFSRFTPRIEEAIRVLEENGILDWGTEGTESEFFVIRLKDKYALPALMAYSKSAEQDDPEYALEVSRLAERSGSLSPYCKRPD